LTRKIAHFSHILLFVIIGLALVTFGAGVIRGQGMVDMFMAAVALAVGAIPEGLPAAVTITLAIGVSRMAKRRAVIRKLPAVETLGSTTVICSDKTGTLTENQMTVKEIAAGENIYTVEGSGYAPEGDLRLDDEKVETSGHAVLMEVLQSGMLCNDSSLASENGFWRVQGDPTEGALIASARKAGFRERELEERYPRLDTIPFESQHQYMATLHRDRETGAGIIHVKGSVEAVLERSSLRIDGKGEQEGIDPEAVQAAADQLSGRGLRVLAFARKRTKDSVERIDHSDIEGDLEFLGLQAMIDPPRKEAVEAVKVCLNAGIEVKMITGDHALTAGEIGRQIGLRQDALDPEHRTSYTGRELAEMTDKQLMDAAQNATIFARVTPEQKLRLVEALQAQSQVVAMTGDGVNDAPALKRADIGVAMGINGTEVAKEASDMVLTDDNFASIEAAVEEGRGVFDNLTKFIVWTLPTNLGEGLVILAAIFAGVMLPILPLQILWINMTTAVLLGLMLAFEPKEPGIMTRMPRNPKTPILTRSLILRILLVGAMMLVGAFGIFRWELDRGVSIEEARTAAVNVFVFVEMFYLFNSRSLTRSVFEIGFFTNRLLFAGVGAMLVLQLMFTYLPLFTSVFESAPIGWDVWLRILLVAAATSLIVAVEKWLTQKFAGRAPKAG
jgi:Ca2+-transporting ATPase